MRAVRPQVPQVPAREEKYYLADLGIYYARYTDARVSYGPSLENVLYVYLRSHGYRVSVGRIGKLECDFICRRHDDYSYVQVAMTIADRAVEDREYRLFAYIRDNTPSTSSRSTRCCRGGTG